jgi:peptide/nickel transport system permease protein
MSTAQATGSDVPVVNLGSKKKENSNRNRFLRAFFRNRIAMVGIVIISIMLFAAAFAEFVAPYDPNELNFSALQVPPSTDHLLGTDDFGRDILSRLIYGARVSLVIAFIAQTVAILIGVTLGLISGWFGGRIDDVIMRITDGFFAIPSLMFLIVWVAVIDPNDIFLFELFENFGIQPRQFSIFLALGLIGWPADARMMRSQVLATKEREFVLAAQAMGASNQRIMLRHLLPNCIAPSIVLASLGIAGAILTESTLGFLGLGVEIPNPSWGTMIDTGRYFTETAWWYSIFPGVAIMVTVLGFNFIGDGLRDALDPKLYR